MFFPVFLNIESKRCLVVGAGNIAARKIKTLKEHKGDITVIAPQISQEIREIEGIEIIERKFQKEDLESKFIVVAATDSKELNSEIANLCSGRNILVNNITSRTEMNLSFASIIEGEDYKIGVSGKGDPKRAIEIKEAIKKALTVK